MRKRQPQTMAVPHQNAALFLHVLIICIFGLLALACIVGGIVALFQKSESKTQFDILGAHLSTSSVGVAFVGIGLLIAFFTVRSVLHNQRQLAELPLDEKRDPNTTTITQKNITTGGDNAGRDIIKN